MNRGLSFLIFFLFFFAACGGAHITTVADGSNPVLFNTIPLIASRDSDVTLTGTGFSIIPQENVILVGGVAIVASNFISNGSSESITFHLPEDVSVGDQTLVVLVEGTQALHSNAITCTVTP